ncbi:MAG: hypothetical protein EZS28_051835 [Streblomastix strix]|uniref:Uncharacterized protein n=1 Tax=Streblomastix strix TaxID=222440 RepID=A0A5J4T2H8_9EUKA|nr:MAG: hypothetical protein EZS28_051835 [Streblomastix strix]
MKQRKIKYDNPYDPRDQRSQYLENMDFKEYYTLMFNKLDVRYLTRNGNPSNKARYYLKKVDVKPNDKCEHM